VVEAGGIPVELGIVPDNIIKISEKIGEGLRKADIIITIGGSSAGEKDLVPRAIDSMGKPGVIIHGIKRKPGRVSGLGIINGKPIVMLPGLIQSTIVGFHVFALPLIQLASGLSTINSATTIRAKIAEEVSFKSFTAFQQVTFVKIKRTQDGLMAEPLIGESSLLSIPVKANGFIVTPEHKSIIKKWEEIEVHFIPGLFSFINDLS
jgi:molybdenum cofactor synthesis domain-containing protein